MSLNPILIEQINKICERIKTTIQELGPVTEKEQELITETNIAVENLQDALNIPNCINDVDD